MFRPHSTLQKKKPFPWLRELVAKTKSAIPDPEAIFPPKGHAQAGAASKPKAVCKVRTASSI